MRDTSGRAWYLSRGAGIHAFHRTDDPFLARVFPTPESAVAWATDLPGPWKRHVIGGCLALVVLEIDAHSTGRVIDMGSDQFFEAERHPVPRRREHDLVKRYAMELEAREVEHEGID